MRSNASDDDLDIAATSGSHTVSSPRHVHVRFAPGHCDDSSGTASTTQSLTSASTLESKLDPPPTTSAPRKGMLQDAIFPAWRDDASGADVESPEELEKKDPLGTQMWRLFSRTKAQIPNQERLENLTWRMMSMKLRQQQDLERTKAYAWPLPPQESFHLCGYTVLTTSTIRSVLREQGPIKQPIPTVVTSAPSGIARLRKSVDKQREKPATTADQMNLDDFIFPSSVASPAGLSPSPAADGNSSSVHATAPTIPIRRHSQMNDDQELHPIRASAPQLPPAIQTNNEFGYVPRHVRKTSIDERRVSGVPRRSRAKPAGV